MIVIGSASGPRTPLLRPRRRARVRRHQHADRADDGCVPALFVPCGFDGDDLPIGLQIIGRPFDETTVLRVGHGFQRETTWHEATPRIGDDQAATG